MILNNYKNRLKLFLVGGRDSYISHANNQSGADRYILPYQSGFKDWKVVCGNGTRPTDPNDYALSGALTSLSYLQVNILYGVDNSGFPYVEKVIAVTNTGNAPVSISEIGAVSTEGYAITKGGGRTNFDDILMERTVLPENIVIEVGETISIRYRLTSLIPESSLW